MPTIQVHARLDRATRTAVGRLLEAVERATGRPPLSDHLRVDLARGGGDGFVAATATDGGQRGGDERVVAYGQVSAANQGSAMEVVRDPDAADPGVTQALVGALLDELARRGEAAVDWFVTDPGPTDDAVATAFGMAPSRRLLQMRRPLPTGMEVTIETRAAVRGDDEAWLEVNNRAFAGHGEQGGWTMETLRRRQGEPWFDRDDVRVLDRDGRLAGFCWTKVHPATVHEPELGEIYVIAVHPDFHGQGLGGQLTLAGLDHLARRGVTTAMLWVDAGNAVAVHLYERLGFEVTATTVAYRAHLVPAAP